MVGQGPQFLVGRRARLFLGRGVFESVSMMDQRENLGLRLGAIVLALVTVAAVIFGVINFQQRHGVRSSGRRRLLGGRQSSVHAAYIAARLSRRARRHQDRRPVAGHQWRARSSRRGRRQAPVGLGRRGRRCATPWNATARSFEARWSLRPRPSRWASKIICAWSAWFICSSGLFIFARRWNGAARRAFLHFLPGLVCSVFFHYTGKLNAFDWEIYWCKVVAMLLAPALLVHFALLFPETRA